MDGRLPPRVTRPPGREGTLHATLAARLCGDARPAVREADGSLVDGAAIWAAAGVWAARLHEAGAGAGDRVVCALPPGAAFAALLVAALGNRWTFVPLRPGEDLSASAQAVGARAAIGADGGLRTTSGAGVPTPDARLLLATSGTTGAPRRLAISEANLGAVLATHVGPLALERASLLSVLPWHHAFGLVLELLPALLAGATLIREPTGGREVGSMVAYAQAASARGTPVTHLHAVPQTVRLLAGDDAGTALLAQLRGGLIGGAPIDAALAEALAHTRLRVGYGQTEASPGVCLGASGAWRAGTLGTPLGCAVRVDVDGVLAFRGANACLGEWRDTSAGLAPSLDALDPDRWVRTGDLAVAEADGTYTFVGRAAESFKLENGRYVAPLPIEAAIRARFRGVCDAVLTSTDGVSLVLGVSVDGEMPAAGDVRPLLGALAERPLRVMRVAREAWVRTPKGEIDRRFPVGRST